jgi:site-specific recombinase XerD
MTAKPSPTDRSVANIVKAYATRAGFDASLFSGHSLRAGFLTSAAGKGASIFKMRLAVGCERLLHGIR